MSPRAVVVHGEPGLGKTSLLYEVQRRCKEAECEFVHGGLAASLDERERNELLLGAIASGGVVLVDGLEYLDGGRAELLETALAQLPAGACFVAARCGRPPLRHSTTVVEVVALEPLTDLDQREYLWLRGLPEEHHDAIIALAQGNALLMTLAADAAETWDGPPVMRLVEQRLQEELLLRVTPGIVSGPRRVALDLASLALAVTPELLAAVLAELGHDCAPREVFEWLQSLRFVERVPEGLELHDVVREAWLGRLHAERRPDCERTRGAARRYLQSRLRERNSWSSTFAAISYLDRELELLGALARCPARQAQYRVEVASGGDRDAILDAIERWEGPGSRAAAAVVFDEDPGRFSVCRGEIQPVRALLSTLELPRDAALVRRPELRADPGIGLIQTFVADRGGLADGETALLFRWWMDSGGYQQTSRGLAATATEIHRLTELAPNLAFTFRLVANLEAWAPVYDHYGFDWEQVGSVSVGQQQLTAVVHHWRGRAARDLLLEFEPDPKPQGAGEAEPPAAAPAPADPNPEPEPPPPSAESTADLEALLESRLQAAAEEAGLTPREREVLHLLFLGRSMSEIAIALHIQPRTAKFHQANVLSKLGADSRLDLFRVLL